MDERPILVRIIAALRTAGCQGLPFHTITLVLGTKASEKLDQELEALAALTGGFPIIHTYQMFVGLPKTSRTDVSPNAVIIRGMEAHG